MNDTLRALNRFGLGARAGESRTISEPRGWLRAQLKGGPPALRAPDAASPDAIREAIQSFRQAGKGDPQAKRDARRRLVAITAAEIHAALQERVTSARPYLERLVAFWSNHLCVSAAAKVLVAPFAGSYEREAIRPHVLGRFEDMVLASARHPAMLLYLDNFQSIGPNSRAAEIARRRQRDRGLNENYARELLELHTVGVDGGYTQQDVTELARTLTGWTVSGLRPDAGGRRRLGRQFGLGTDDGSIGFAFLPQLHEPGSRTVLGKRYADDGVAQGEHVIRDLCRHAATAQFVATKLVRHMVADDPPPAAVTRIADVFRESHGDLAAVSHALVELPEAWSADTRKFRPPQEWYVAVLRAFHVEMVGDMAPVALRQLRQPLWAPQAPKGFGDTTQEWADPDSLMNRAELSRTFARRLASGGDPGALLEVVDVPAGDPLRSMVLDASISHTDRLALGIAGPAFQWR